MIITRFPVIGLIYKVEGNMNYFFRGWLFQSPNFRIQS